MKKKLESPLIPCVQLEFVGIQKCAALRGGARDVILDERIAVGMDIMSAHVPALLRLVYPPLYPVADPSGDWGRPDATGKWVAQLLLCFLVDQYRTLLALPGGPFLHPCIFLRPVSDSSCTSWTGTFAPFLCFLGNQHRTLMYLLHVSMLACSLLSLIGQTFCPNKESEYVS